MTTIPNYDGSLWMPLASGHAFDFYEALHDVDQPIVTDDIALGLARTYRCNGQFPTPVAEHSLMVSARAEQLARERGWSGSIVRMAAALGLLHDGQEAYVGDQIYPLRKLFRLMGVTLFDELEAKVQQQVERAYGFTAYVYIDTGADVFLEPVRSIVHQADIECVALEKTFMPPVPPGRMWQPLPDVPQDMQIRELSVTEAYNQFRARARELDLRTTWDPT